MNSAMMMERASIGMAGMGAPSLGTGPMGAPTAMPGVGNMMMVPRCTITMEKATGGMKILCKTDDKMSASMMQNLCAMLMGSACSCCVMMNGMMVCTCNLTMGMCKCEATDDGVCITCTSGDSSCSAMIQACCN